MTPRLFLFALCCALGCREVEVHRSEIVLSESTRQLAVRARLTGEGTQRIEYTSYAGFGCVDHAAATAASPAPLVMQRAFSFDAGSLSVTMRASFVVDAIRLDGYPRCRATEIYNYCAGQECRPIASERRCLDLAPWSVPLGENGRLLDVATRTRRVTDAFHDYMRDGLADQLVTRAALGEEVLYRLVGTTQTCAELAASGSLEFAPQALLGCSYSCPLVPAAARGEIVLDLEALGNAVCEPSIRACASARFSPAARDEPAEVGGIGE